MINMVDYIKKLFHKWYIYLGIPASFSDYALVLVGFDDVKIPDVVRYIAIFLTFLYASYRVWADEKKENERLQALQINLVDYEVIGKLYPIDFEIEIFLKIIDDNILKAQKEIEIVNTDISKIPPDFTDLDINPFQLSPVASIAMKLLVTSSKNSSEQTQYINKLKIYVRELSNCIDHYKESKIELINRIDSMQNRFFCEFLIQNTGKKSDSQIDINIRSDQNKFLKGYQGYDLLELIAILPLEKPVAPKTSSYLDIYNTPDLSNLIRQKPHNDYKTNIQIVQTNIAERIRDMNVGEEVQVVDKKLFIDFIDQNDFYVIIKSKESNAVIEKKVVIMMQVETKKIREILHS